MVVVYIYISYSYTYIYIYSVPRRGSSINITFRGVQNVWTYRYDIWILILAFWWNWTSPRHPETIPHEMNGVFVGGSVVPSQQVFGCLKLTNNHTNIRLKFHKDLKKNIFETKIGFPTGDVQYPCQISRCRNPYKSNHLLRYLKYYADRGAWIPESYSAVIRGYLGNIDVFQVLLNQAPNFETFWKIKGL